MIIISPSLLACNFAEIGNEIKKVHRAGCKYLHLDVMDGIFVKNITFGIPVISSVRKVCDIIFDTHLMIVNPIRYIGDFARAGSDIITFHYEACKDNYEILNTIDEVRAFGMKCSMAVKPSTPAEELYPFLSLLDMVLIMSVEPGFGGQKFIPDALEKIKLLKEVRDIKDMAFDIQVDGGVTLENAGEIKKAGANILVAGTSIFEATDINDTVKQLTCGT